MVAWDPRIALDLYYVAAADGEPTLRKPRRFPRDPYKGYISHRKWLAGFTRCRALFAIAVSSTSFDEWRSSLLLTSCPGDITYSGALRVKGSLFLHFAATAKAWE
jgi:hypothetical protein